MRWTPGYRSSNVEDRRGQGGRFVRGAGGLGLGGVVILLVLSLVTGQNFLAFLGGGDVSGAGPEAGAPAGPVSSTPEEEALVQFVSFVLDDAQNTWAQILPEYRPARLVLFRNAVQSACGSADAAMGPFYCPADEKVYIDLGFYDELRSRFGAPGDFAQAYVLAHEIGHHVQNVVGTEAQTRRLRAQRPDAANEISVRVELQADCYAGVWANSTAQRDLLERGDVEEALGAASAVGDDRIQEMATGTVHPESFTHGTAAQRAEWFRRGFDAGNPEVCNTFGR